MGALVDEYSESTPNALEDVHCDRLVWKTTCTEASGQPDHMRRCGWSLFTELHDTVGCAALWRGTWEPFRLGTAPPEQRGHSLRATGGIQALSELLEERSNMIVATTDDAKVISKEGAKFGQQCLIFASNLLEDDLTLLYHRYCFDPGGVLPSNQSEDGHGLVDCAFQQRNAQLVLQNQCGMQILVKLLTGEMVILDVDTLAAPTCSLNASASTLLHALETFG